MKSFSQDIGIDLGTCNTLIHIRGKGIVLIEPSVVAVEKGTNRLVAVGTDAKGMLSRTPRDIIAKRPLRDGVIADPDLTEKMIKYFIQKVVPKNWFFKPRIVIGSAFLYHKGGRKMPSSIPAYKAGARTVKVIAESLAAAIGAGIPIIEPAGTHDLRYRRRHD